MKALLAGFGEIGKGMYEIFSKVHEVKIIDFTKGESAIITKVDILLIAFPWSTNFDKDVIYYQTTTKATATIIFSTVPIGTCKRLNACHFPVEAKHPHIGRDVMLNKSNFFGLAEGNKGALDFLRMSGINYRTLLNTDWTEFLKLRSTAIYGLNIEFARYSHGVANQIGMIYDVIKEYDQAHNELTAERGTPEHSRYILDPPEGQIGGHCVVPNAKILDQQFPSVFLKEIYWK